EGRLELHLVPLGPQVFSQHVVNRVLLRDPPLERHTTGASDLETIAIGRWLTRVRREPSMPAVKRDELLHVIGKVHGLLNDLIRPQQQRLWDCEAKRLGGLCVDDQLELGGLLDGKLRGLCASENPVNIVRQPPSTNRERVLSV